MPDDIKNSQSARKALLDSILLGKLRSSSNMHELMDQLSEVDLADCILSATISGGEALVRALVERRGPVPILVECTNPDSTFHKLNGESVQTNIAMFGQYLKSRKELKSLLAMIVELDMKGLIEPGKSYPLLWQKLDKRHFLSRLESMRFYGDLPSLNNGVLSQPELAIALHEEASRVSAPDAYKPMLCWASADMVSQFCQHLAPLIAYQNANGYGSMAKWKEDSISSGSLDVPTIEVGVRPTERSTPFANHLFYAMGPASSHRGLEDQQGRVLCETTTEFLLEFSVAACEEGNLAAANAFVDHYCPAEIMALQAAEVGEREFGTTQGIYRFPDDLRTNLTSNFDLLFLALTEDPRVRDLMTKEQWGKLLLKATTIHPEALVALYQIFGFDNSGKDLNLGADDLQTLIKGSYRFADGTKVFESEPAFHKHNYQSDLHLAPSVHIPQRLSFASSLKQNRTLQEVLEFALKNYLGIHKMNLWPTQGAKPTDLADAIKLATRVEFGDVNKSKTMALHAYLLDAGVEACAQAASSPTQWMKLLDVFSGEELQPYLKVMPNKVRGRLLENGMGL